MTNKHYRFYMDETDLGGFPFQNLKPREDGLNCFCYAGVLIAEENIEPIRRNYKAFCEKWDINYPLHYNAIRGKTGNFKWIGQKNETHFGDNRPKNHKFVDEYHEFMAEQPYRAFGCIVNKENFYKTHSFGNINYFTAIKNCALKGIIISIIENSVLEKSTVSIYFEEVGRKEDQNIIQTIKDVIDISKFNSIINDATSVNKNTPFTQIADFCALPIAKSIVENNYRPFSLLKEKSKIYRDKYQNIGISYLYFPPQKE